MTVTTRFQGQIGLRRTVQTRRSRTSVKGSHLSSVPKYLFELWKLCQSRLLRASDGVSGLQGKVWVQSVRKTRFRKFSRFTVSLEENSQPLRNLFTGKHQIINDQSNSTKMPNSFFLQIDFNSLNLQ